ncbi:MAG: aminoacyl-tRNA hydrolase [Proteobacteria bacterium]|nr:aminoacyl-tRNA hydrolase [Pseudomonadota bacterium]MBU4296574.1 aminoacyl-tRNA hydrolase [Pseudomonadota bacterium]MCG2748827.1 aminoacyl-tRNA hydrolase [Desulfobulbaceae bacterium]
MLFITDTLSIPMREIHFSFIRASGPGGQHVNRSATAVQLRFDVQNSPSLSMEIKNRLSRLAGSRLSKDGVLTIEAQEFRSQMRNRDEALQRLARLIHLATMRKKTRRPTRPTMAAKKRRLETKKRRSLTKQTRGGHRSEE